MKLKIFILTALCGLISAPAFAAPAACSQQYWGGQAPNVLNRVLAAKTQQICYEGYAVIYSDITETPLESAEHLTRRHLEEHHPRRRDEFHADRHIPWRYRSDLADYRHSGYDRGHQAPSGDMWDRSAQYQSFSLANMIPQNPNDNRHLWEGIEAATRDLAKHCGSLYVVTGPIFYGRHFQRLHGRVWVPTYIFKAIYDPSEQAAAAYLVRNAAGPRYAVISIAKLDRLCGLDVFPDLPQDTQMLRLPHPRIWDHWPAIRNQSIVP